MVLVSLFAFLFSFLFALGGVGAAIILIPLLVMLGYPVNIAKPVGLFYNTISLSSASYHNIKNKKLDFKLAIPIIISSFVFAPIGAFASKFVPSKTVLFLFIVFLIFSSAMFLFFKSKKYASSYREDIPFLYVFFVGMFSGFISGLLGVGGGSIISPLLLMAGFNPKRIASVTAFVVPFSSFAAFITYLSMGHIRWILLITVSFFGILGAYLGTVVMHKKLNHTLVKRIIAIILLAVAIKMILKLI